MRFVFHLAVLSILAPVPAQPGRVALRAETAATIWDYG
jgi:hypothetical protein